MPKGRASTVSLCPKENGWRRRAARPEWGGLLPVKALGRDGEATPSRRAAAAGGRRSGGRPFATRALGPSAKFASSTDCSCAAEIGGAQPSSGRAQGGLRAKLGGVGRRPAGGRASTKAYEASGAIHAESTGATTPAGTTPCSLSAVLAAEGREGARQSPGRCSREGGGGGRRGRRGRSCLRWMRAWGPEARGWRRGWRGMEGAGRTGRDALGEHPLGQARANRQVAHVHAPVLACRLAGAAKGRAEGARRVVHPLEAIPEALGLYRGSAPDQQ